MTQCAKLLATWHAVQLETLEGHFEPHKGGQFASASVQQWRA